MRKIASLFPMLILLCSFAFGQTRTITGVVRDDKGIAVPFATITEVGTKNAAQADASGLFSIKIGANATLSISATGFNATTITPKEGTENAITLTPGANQNLQEVVVTTALGINRSKKSIGYATQAITAEKLTPTKVADLNTAMAGKIAGLQIRGGSGAKFG